MKFHFILLFLLILSPQLIVAQKDKKKNNYKVSRQPLQIRNNPADVQLTFKNINRFSFYSNPAVLQQIAELEKKQDYKALLPVLNEYVSNFGIKNFDTDSYLIWKLGQLSEKTGNLEKAKWLYRLVLRHHRGDLSKVRRYYDSVSVNDDENYLPISYYYELVEYRKSIDTLLPPVGIQINMGQGINSEAADYGPTLNEKDNLLFTSKRNTVKRSANGKPTVNEDIFYAKNLGGGYWDNAVELSTINTQYNEGSAQITRDGKTLYFARCNSPDGYGNCDIYVARLQADSTWGDVENIGPNVNSSSWDSQPCLSHSEDTLYFASDRISGFGLSDIYYTFRMPDGQWSKPQNAGPVINTRLNDVSPFLHPVYDILYFSSGGQRLNFGGFDIFKSYRKNNQWQDPFNIGPLVNGNGDEYYFAIDFRSKYLFYARSDSSTGTRDNLDLFSFPLPMEAQPLATTTLGGTVKDSVTGQPFTGIVSVVDLTERIEVAPKALRPDGSFSFNLIKGHEYLVIITGEDFFRIEQTVRLEGDTQLEFITPAIKFKRWAFASLNFEPSKAEILTGMKPDLDKLLNFLLDHPTFKIYISGHTDGEGEKADNLKLSQRRANAIRDYLLKASRKVAASRVEARGYGNTKPLVEEKTEQDKRINRRVEFEIEKMGGN
jgi:hypothetical protein